MLQCEECFMWRLVYAKRKLTFTERRVIKITLMGCHSHVDQSYKMQTFHLTLKPQCTDPVEKLLFGKPTGYLYLLF